MEIIKSIEMRGIELRDRETKAFEVELDQTSPTISLPFERPLYTPKAKIMIDSSVGDASEQDIDAAAMFRQVYVDPAPLRRRVRAALTSQPQVGLAKVISDEPLEQGLAELVTYLTLTDGYFDVVYDEADTEQIHWRDDRSVIRVATMPRTTFTRTDR